MKSDYSEKEFEMIKTLSPNWARVIESDADSDISQPRVLEIIALQCFMENKNGKAVDSLRRCLQALHNCNPYRNTPDYDALIEL